MELQKIKEIVELYCRKDIAEVTRKQNIVFLRAVYYRLSRTLTGCSLSEIGKVLNKDHASVLHGLKIWDQIATFEYYSNLYSRCLEELTHIQDTYFRAEISKEAKITDQDKEIMKLKNQIEGMLVNMNHPIFKQLTEFSGDQLTEFYCTRFTPYKKALESRIEQIKVKEVKGALLNQR